MQRRKFLIGLGSLAAGTAAATGTGAFTQMSSGNRGVNIEVADDSVAYTSLTPIDGPNGQLADGSGNKLKLDFSEDNSTFFAIGGFGVNEGSTYEFDNVFEITNMGTQDIYWWLSKNNLPGVYFYADKDGTADDPSDSIVGKSNAKDTSVSQSLPIGVKIVEDELNGSGLREVSGSIQVHGQATPDYKDWENSQ
jgi:hypothetical protein